MNPEEQRQRLHVIMHAPARNQSALPDARQWFRYLRERLMSSRPVIAPERVIPFKAGEIQWQRVIPAVYGKPTFQNRIDEDCRHV